MQPHIIISAQNLIESNSVQQAELLQKKLYEVWNSDKFLNELDNLLSKTSSENEWVILDKLELDLEGLSLNISHAHLKNLILEKVNKSLQKTVNGTQQNNVGLRPPKHEQRDSSQQVFKGQLVDEFTQAWERLVSKQRYANSFLSTFTSLQELFTETKRQFIKEDRSFTNWVSNFVNTHKNLFVVNLPIEVFTLFITEAIPKHKETFTGVLQVVLMTIRTKQEESKTILLFAKGQLYKAFTEKGNPERFDKTILYLKGILNKLVDEEVKLEALIAKNDLGVKPIQEKEVKRPEQEIKHQAPDDKIYIDNAGMAITFPYLNMVFKNLGYSNETVLEKPSRAIHFLSFLETGEAFYAPHRMALYKVICGQTQGYWIDPDIVLSDFEKDEAQSLLKSVIEHWGALKNSSPEGLREAFLRRKGKLSRKDFDFNLKVESQAQDILLTRIPWGFSTIKLPWMTNFLHVDW